MKIAVLVEGRTEKAFFPFLRDFLHSRLPGSMPNLDPVVYLGRIPKEAKLRRIVGTLLLGTKPADAVIALTDVYTGTNDFTTAHDAKAKMATWVGGVANFFPHVALHDFEAWLLPYWNRIQQLAKHEQNPPAGAPESVNHNKPPSKVIAELFERGACRDSYSKERDSKRILNGQDLISSINSCPELKAFVNRILGLCGGQAIP
ncbi:MAG: DUF4276 family protein [Patescibacteria group bacterium]